MREEEDVRPTVRMVDVRGGLYDVLDRPDHSPDWRRGGRLCHSLVMATGGSTKVRSRLKRRGARQTMSQAHIFGPQDAARVISHED